MSYSKSHVPFFLCYGANANNYENYLLGTSFTILFTDYSAQNYLGKKRKQKKMHNYYA
jgi:hypothetical protein